MICLPNNRLSSGALLEEHLEGRPDAGTVIGAIAEAAGPLAEQLAAGCLLGDPNAVVGVNESGDKQKALDLAAHEHMLDALASAGVARVLSEEAETVADLSADGRWDVAIDPIDGSQSIGTGAPLGTLFAVYEASDDGFLRSGRAVIAAGYVVFGHSVDLGFSLGDGVTIATLDRTVGAFRIVREDVRISPATTSIAYNASNERHWPKGLRDYARDLRSGKDGPRDKNFNMRWLAAAVGELHRILLQGGTFLYPADRRPGYENGRLRLVYEAFPIAFLVEQASGVATDGRRSILDFIPTELHQRTPLVFGAATEVETIGRYLGS